MRVLSFVAALAIVASRWEEVSAFSSLAPPSARCGSTCLSMVVKGTSKLGKALKKPTGALTVGFEAMSGVSSLVKTDLDALSLTLRKSKAAAIFADPSCAGTIAKEQAKAKGNFPGPCPVVWMGVASDEDVQSAKDAGAQGVVLSLAGLGREAAVGLAEAAVAKGVDPVWEIVSKEEAEMVADAGVMVVLVSAAADDAVAIREALPKDIVAVAAVKAMQEGGMEAELARSLKESGYHSVVLREACVGDKEDEPYAKWAAESLLSKQSKEFKITGMTGHVNGHYGTGTFEKSQADIVWERNA